MNIEESYSAFIEYLKSHGKSQSTLLAYGKDIEQLINTLKVLNIKEIDQFDTTHIDGFLAELKAKKYTPKSISRKLNSIKTFSKVMVELGYITSNPAKLISHPKLVSKTPRVLSELEYRALRDIIRADKRLYTIVELMLQTGVRIGEVARLEVSDLTIDGNDGKLLIKKYGTNPERMITLNKTAKSCLEEYVNSRASTESNSFFITKSGRGLLVRNIRTSIIKAFQKAKIPDATVNDLRNTFIAHNLAKGANLMEISKIVGHKRISTTEKYVGLIQQEKVKKATVTEEL